LTTSEVEELIAKLRTGSMSLAEVAERFRARSWARTRQPAPRSYLEQAALADSDPEPDRPGSIDEVTAAYDRGHLTREQYQVLARAVAASIDAEDASGDNDSEATESSS
jgi:hypothetical protein